MIFRLEDFELGTQRLELRDNSVATPLEPQAFSVLAYLVENRDRVRHRSSPSPRRSPGRVRRSPSRALSLGGTRVI